MTSEDVKRELLKKDGVDDDFFKELVGEEPAEKKVEEMDDDFFNDLVGEKEEEKKEEKEEEEKEEKEEKEEEETTAVFTKHEMTHIAKHRTFSPSPII